MNRYLKALFFFLVIASESNAWVRAFIADRGLEVGKAAGALSSGNGDTRLFALNMMMIVFTMAICVPKMRKLLAVMFHLRWFLGVYLFTVLTVAWSVNQANSFRLSLYLLLGLVQVVYLGVDFEVWEQIAIVGDVTVLFALLSLPAQFLMKPPQEMVPGWAGIFPTKNFLGNVMALGIIALLLRRERWGATQIARVALCFGMLLMSQSFTSLMCVVVVAAVMLYQRLERGSRMIVLTAGIGSAVLIGIFVSNPMALLLGGAGKDTTLTGRDVIWAFALKFVALRPFGGWGYNSFWISQNDAAFQYLGWNPGQAHNGFLELLLDEGIVGLGLLLVLLADGLRRARREMKLGDPTGGGLWLLLMTVYLMFHNISEADFYQRPAWVIYAIAYIAVAQLQWKAAWMTKYGRRTVPVTPMFAGPIPLPATMGV